MKACSRCGSANDDALLVCGDCGADLECGGAALPSQPAKVMLGLIGLAALGIAVFTVPALLAIPVLALFYLPIYLPLLLSLLVKSNDWRGMRWSLRASTVAALLVWFSGNVGRPDFGNDVAGNLAGAIHNFYWTWGGGVACALVSGVVGLAFHVVHTRQSNSQPARDSSE